VGPSPTCCAGDFKAYEYGQVILPLVVLRRLECALVATKDKVVAKGEELATQLSD
jgi:type I restriction enzyme M protein